MYQKFSFGKVAALPELKRLQAEVEKSARHSMVWSSTSSPTSTHVADGCSIKLRSEINGDSSSVLKVSPEYMSLNQDTRHLLSDHIVHPVWMPFAETLVRYSISPHSFFVESLFTTFGIKNFDDALACFHAAMYFKLEERFFCYFYRICI